MARNPYKNYGYYIPGTKTWRGTEFESLEELVNFYRRAIDESTDSLNIIDYDHHEIHVGSAYVNGTSATLATDATLDILIQTGSAAATTKRAHMVFEVRSTGESHVVLYEDTDVADAGVATASPNRRRDSSKTAVTSIYFAPTLNAVGTQLGPTRHIGSGQIVGGESRGTNEFVLKPDTYYLIRITSEANSNDCSILLNWYEHSDHAFF